MTHILRHDDTGFRKELIQSLARLSPAKRVEFVTWCAGQVKSRMLHAPKVVCDGEYTAMEAYGDCIALSVNWALDINAVMVKLIEMVRKCPATPA